MWADRNVDSHRLLKCQFIFALFLSKFSWQEIVSLISFAAKQFEMKIHVPTETPLICIYISALWMLI